MTPELNQLLNSIRVAPQSRMQTLFDPKGLQGELARGSNVYAGGLPGPPGAGRPRKPTPVSTGGAAIDPGLMAAVQRRLSGGSSNNPVSGFGK